MKEKELEEIYYDLGIGDMEVLESDKEISYLICKVVYRLPEDIQKLIFDKVIFMFTDIWGTVYHLNVEDKKEVYVIHLNINRIRSDEKKMDIIAHEIGHFVSEVKGMIQWGDPEGEEIADDLAEKWGFNRGETKKKGDV